MPAWEEQLASLTPAKRALLDRLRKASAPSAAIKRRDANSPAPLSFAQQRLWLVHQLDPESYLFNVPRGLRLRGRLNLVSLERSLNQVIQRHEVLRTVFRGEAGALEQVINEPSPVHLAVRDVAPEQLLEEATREFQRPFDLETGPMLRATLWRVGEDEHVLLIVLHHIVSDAWTTAILFNEIGALYGGAQLPELTAQYADYAAWQHQHLSGNRLTEEIAWWKKALEGAPAALHLPLDSPRPNKETSKGELFEVLFPFVLLEKLRQLSRQESATLYMVLLAAYSVLLARYSGQNDIVTGTDFSTRTNMETERMIGFFINLLPVRVRVSGESTFRELVAQAKSAALGVYAHPDLPFEKLVEELQPERVPSRHPLVQVLLVMQNIPRSALQMQGLQVEEFHLPFNTSKFDLALFMEEEPEGLSARWVYHAELFRPETIRKMARHLETLLENAVANLDVPINSLEMLAESERLERDLKNVQSKQSKLGKLRKTMPSGVNLHSVE